MTPLDVDAVIFDVGGVFVVPSPTVVRDRLAGIAGIDDAPDGAFVAAHYHGIAAYDRSEDPPERWPAYLAAYLTALGAATDDEARTRAIELWRTPSTGLWTHAVAHHVAALQRIADEADVRLGIISNSDGTIEQVLADQRIAQVGDGPGVPVEVIVDSYLVGVTKPDPTIFPFALEPMGLPPERCAYVGDSFRNDVEGATAAGLTPVHVDPHGLGPAGEHRRVHEVGDLLEHLPRR
ncbi:MAG: HAD family hydrolase [Actinomycetota bacterium]